MIKTKLSIMINESFRQGVFPSNLKVDMVYPIHKGDSEMVCSNYPYLSYQYLANFFKDHCRKDCQITSVNITSCMTIKLDFKKENQLSMQH